MVRPDVYQRGERRVRRLARPKPTIATFGALLAPAVPAPGRSGPKPDGIRYLDCAVCIYTSLAEKR